MTENVSRSELQSKRAVINEPSFLYDQKSGSEHIPDLIRMVTDEKLNDADIGDVAGWAPMHAYRALAQLHTERAIEPLLSLLELFREINDFAMEELPYVRMRILLGNGA